MSQIAGQSFVPSDFDPSSYANIEPLGEDLLNRPLDTPEQLQQWIVDASDFFSVIPEFGSRRYID
ncbi:MAG: hypothetical protein WD079_02335, partial [Phycisphaeraceae bacterium]